MQRSAQRWMLMLGVLGGFASSAGSLLLLWAPVPDASLLVWDDVVAALTMIAPVRWEIGLFTWLGGVLGMMAGAAGALAFLRDAPAWLRWCTALLVGTWFVALTAMVAQLPLVALGFQVANNPMRLAEDARVLLQPLLYVVHYGGALVGLWVVGLVASGLARVPAIACWITPLPVWAMAWLVSVTLEGQEAFALRLVAPYVGVGMSCALMAAVAWQRERA